MNAITTDAIETSGPVRVMPDRAVMLDRETVRVVHAPLRTVSVQHRDGEVVFKTHLEASEPLKARIETIFRHAKELVLLRVNVMRSSKVEVADACTLAIQEAVAREDF